MALATSNFKKSLSAGHQTESKSFYVGQGTQKKLPKCTRCLRDMKHGYLIGCNFPEVLLPDLAALFHKHAHLTEAEEIVLILKAQSGDADAKKELLSANIDYIAASACYYKSCTRMSHEDLFVIGVLGFLNAVDTFKLGKGARLITHMEYTMSSVFQQAINKEYESDLQHFDLMAYKLVNESDDDEEAAKKFVKAALEEAIKTLDPREQKVVELKEERKTYREIGEELGISVSRVNQIFKKSIRKIREYINNNYDEDFDEVNENNEE